MPITILPPDRSCMVAYQLAVIVGSRMPGLVTQWPSLIFSVLSRDEREQRVRLLPEDVRVVRPAVLEAVLLGELDQLEHPRERRIGHDGHAELHGSELTPRVAQLGGFLERERLAFRPRGGERRLRELSPSLLERPFPGLLSDWIEAVHPSPAPPVTWSSRRAGGPLPPAQHDRPPRRRRPQRPRGAGRRVDSARQMSRLSRRNGSASSMRASASAMNPRSMRLLAREIRIPHASIDRRRGLDVGAGSCVPRARRDPCFRGCPGSMASERSSASARIAS